MFQFKSQLPAHPREVSLNFPRASECCLNMRQNIFSSNMLQKIGA